MVLEELLCTKPEHQCYSNEMNGKAWEECGAMAGSEARLAFLDVRNLFLITFLTIQHSLVAEFPFWLLTN